MRFVAWSALALGALCLTPALSRSATPPSASVPDWYHLQQVQWAIQDLWKINTPTARAGSPSKACVSAYERVYRNPTLKVGVFFGYLNKEKETDSQKGDEVLDPFEKSLFRDTLIRPCYKGMYACGFQSQDGPHGSYQLTKEMEGPDGKPRTVIVTVESAAASESDRANRHELKGEQRELSRDIQRDFETALGDSDVVLYVGHARYGTGPGYKPIPKLSLTWLQAGILKPSLRKMESALKNADPGPALIGIYACYTEKYYRKKLEKSAPNAGLVLTNEETTFEQVDVASIATLDSILGMRCEEGFEKSVRDNGAELSGFFSP